jgi:EAL domain-containing protein (putative c-di-GMP-specific phosphodiesterase class I)
VERWLGEPTHPYAALFAKHGIMANAYAPIVMDGAPIGVLVTGSDQDDAVDRMTERLPALLEFSAISGALLAGAIADRLVAATRLAGIRSIISQAQFAPVFQPIVDLTTGRVCGYEALTRFRDGTAPDVRFDAAHELGAGLELEVACLRASFDAARGLPDGAWLNVNVSPQMVLSGLVEATLPAGDREIILEITEQQAIADYDAFRTAMEPIRGRVKLAIDDAGAGFASLRHVVELAPAMVKLDRSLVAGIASNDARSAVVSGMVRFAEAAGLVLLAEGIETPDELATLRQLGVQLGQGFLLGRPAPVQPVLVEPAVALAARAPRPARKVPALLRRPVAGAVVATMS